MDRKIRGQIGQRIKELETAVKKLSGLVDNIILSTQRELTRLEELFKNELSDHMEFVHNTRHHE